MEDILSDLQYQNIPYIFFRSKICAYKIFVIAAKYLCFPLSKYSEIAPNFRILGEETVLKGLDLTKFLAMVFPTYSMPGLNPKE